METHLTATDDQQTEQRLNLDLLESEDHRLAEMCVSIIFKVLLQMK
jgi:hypothetical protein